MLKDVLIYSRNVRTDFEKDSINGIIAKSIDLYQDICDEQAITVNTKYTTDLPVLLQKDQVQQAANNLITNGIDAMPDGGTLTISTELQEANNIEYVAVHVQDTGAGIPADKLPLVFRTFFHNQENRPGHRTGPFHLQKNRRGARRIYQGKERNRKGADVSMFFPYQSDEELKNAYHAGNTCSAAGC